MNVLQDFADLCSLLNAKQVEYLIVGGYAVAFHGAPRFTGDMDVFVSPEPANVARMLDALREFGFPADPDSARYLVDERKILQLGRIPVQIHIMTSITGITWDQAWATREHGHYGEVPLCYIGRAALIANKTATGRPRDLADLAALRSQNR